MNSALFAQLWFRTTLGSLAYVVWLLLYLSVRVGDRDVRGCKTPLSAAMWLALAASVVCEAVDHQHLAYVFGLNFWGFWSALVISRRLFEQPRQRSEQMHP
jgi:hypothetical protein